MKSVYKYFAKIRFQILRLIKWFANRFSSRFLSLVEYIIENNSVYFFITLLFFLVIGSLIVYEIFIESFKNNGGAINIDFIGNNLELVIINDVGKVNIVFFCGVIVCLLVLSVLVIKLVVTIILQLVSRNESKNLILFVWKKRCFTQVFALFIATISLYLCFVKSTEMYYLSQLMIGKHNNLEVFIDSEPREKSSRTSVVLAVREDILRSILLPDETEIYADFYSGDKTEKSINPDNISATNQILISASIPKYPTVQLGQKCYINGELDAPENYSDFDYEKMLGTKQIYLTAYIDNISCKENENEINIRNFLYRIKSKIISDIENNFTEPSASLIAGFIFGENRLFSDELNQSFKNTGTSHIIAASGYNVNILLLGINKILAGLNKKIRSIISYIGIWLYCLLAGLSASIIRASIMATVAIIGSNLGKNKATINVLIITITIMQIINPLEVYNIGFLLSAGSTFALVILLPTIEQAIEKLKKESVLSVASYNQKQSNNDKGIRVLEGVISNGAQTVSCTIVVLPILVTVFQTISVSTVLANIIILPLVEAALIAGIIWIIVSLIIQKLTVMITVIPSVICNLIASILMAIGKVETLNTSFDNSILTPAIMLYITTLIIFVLIFYPTVYDKNMGI